MVSSSGPAGGGDSGSAIGSMGATLLARGLMNNRGLTSLNLSSNNITDDGMSALCDALKTGACPLQTLDVSNNPCGPRSSAAVLAAVQANTSIIDVTMTGWTMPAEHSKILGSWVQLVLPQFDSRYAAVALFKDIMLTLVITEIYASAT